VMLTLGYAIANPLELDRRLLPIGGREFEAEVSHGGEIITIWRYDDVNESTYGWAGPCGQNEEVLKRYRAELADPLYMHAGPAGQYPVSTGGQ